MIDKNTPFDPANPVSPALPSIVVPARRGLFKPKKADRPAKPSKFPWRTRYIVLLFVMAFLLITAFYGFFTFQAVKQQVNQGVAHLQTVQSSLKPESAKLNQAVFDQVHGELLASQTNFQQARQDLGLFEGVLPWFGWLPGVGYDLSHLPTLLQIAEKSAQTGVLVIEGGQPALLALSTDTGNSPDASKSALSTGGNSKLMTALDLLGSPAAQQKFEKAQGLLNEVSRAQAELDPARLGLEQSHKALEQLDRQLPVLQDGLGLVRQLPAFMPGLLGKAGPVSYLVVLQNSDELRPTGGFISAVGLVSLDAGRLSVKSFQDSYAVDANSKNLTASLEPLVRYMGAVYLTLRDSNWWPDFPTSANKILELYNANQPGQPQGLIALDIKTVGYLFEALGPVDLPDYQEHLTAQNFEQRLHYYYLSPGSPTGGDWWLKRKDFIGVVMKALLARLNNATTQDYLKLVTQLNLAVSQKHLQLYFSQPAVEKELTLRGLDGAQLPVTPATLTGNAPAISDYLMLVESNVGFNKVNPKIDRQLDYSVSAPGPGASLFASLTITYTSRAGVREGTEAGKCVKVAKYDSSYEAMINGCYWNYLRLYVPAGSQLSSTEGFEPTLPVEVSSDNGKTVFASQITIPPGQTVVIRLNYTLPFRWQTQTSYSLSLQKQAGIDQLPTSIKLDLAGRTVSRGLNLNKDQILNLGLPVGNNNSGFTLAGLFNFKVL